MKRTLLKDREKKVIISNLNSQRNNLYIYICISGCLISDFRGMLQKDSWLWFAQALYLSSLKGLFKDDFDDTMYHLLKFFFWQADKKVS